MTELERALVALGNELEFPPTPDVAGAVRARLAPRRRWLRPAALVFAVVVVGVGIAMAVPPARSAILRFFHIGAATVERPVLRRRQRLDPLDRAPVALARHDGREGVEREAAEVRELPARAALVGRELERRRRLSQWSPPSGAR